MRYVKKRFIFTIILTVLFSLQCTFVRASASPSIHRMSGQTRYETAASIAKEGWKTSDWAIIAYGENFPDALASTPLANKYKAPILLTDKESLTPITKNTLTDLKVKNVFIVGGTGVVSPNVETELSDMGINITRLYGNDRYDTSVEIANKLDSSDKLIVTSGDDYANALSVSTYAGNNKIPIILVANSSMNTSLLKYLSSHTIQQTYIIGNESEINNTMMNDFPNPTRITGSNKYETNLAVLKYFEPNYSFDNVFVATGNGFADALAGSAIASMMKSPLILVDNVKNIDTESFISNHNISQLNVLGGEGVISSSLVDSYLEGQQSYSPSQIAKIVSPSVVYIETYDQSGNAYATGSGFVVDSNGKIATNYHVINGAYSAKVKTYDGKTYAVKKVFAYSKSQDMALLGIDAAGLVPVTLGDSDNITMGDKIYTIGNPLGLEDTMSDGLISSKSREVGGATYVQISAPISHGSSGGVLVNEKAEVIGITSAGIDEGQNLNFAIPINLLKTLLNQDSNLSLSQVKPTNSSENIALSSIQTYLQQKYGVTEVDGITLKYDIKVTLYSGNSDGSHAGSAFIVFYIQDEKAMITTNPADYLKWSISMMNDIQSKYGNIEYNGGVYSPIYGKFSLMFNNWSGKLEYYIPRWE